jgi:anti-anti-sigma factor
MSEFDPQAQPHVPGDRGATAPPVHSIVRADDGVPEGSVLLVLAGELDLAAAPELRRHLDEPAQGGVRRVVLDLADVQFMDSSMLKELLRANHELREAGATLVLAAPQPPVRRLFELTRTSELFEIADDRASALSG